MIKRRKTRTVKIGNLKIGSDYPVLIQSMGTTKTEDIKQTVKQIKSLEKAGCEMIRVAVPTIEAAKALEQIKKRINMPLIADIHFDYQLALASIKYGVDKIRINPGNIGSLENFKKIIKEAKKKKIAIRIGINAGSLEKNLWEKYKRPSPEALVESCLRTVKIFEQNDFDQLVLAVKSSNVLDSVKSYQLLAAKCDYPLHLGITEAGILIPGAVKSAIGIGSLLLQGIGDTIRVSINEPPEKQIEIAKEILKSAGLYDKEPEYIVCPSCGRAEIKVKKLAEEVIKKTKNIKKHLKIAILGCVVNGPGEAREADFAIAGGKKAGAIYKDGKLVKSVPERNLISEFVKLIKT